METLVIFIGVPFVFVWLLWRICRTPKKRVEVITQAPTEDNSLTYILRELREMNRLLKELVERGNG